MSIEKKCSSIDQQMRFLAEIDQMKSVYRQTLLIDRSRTETDAEHSWHLAMMAMTLFEYGKDPSVDLLRVLQMVLVHDLVEIYAGDTFAYDTEGNRTKAQREKEAADRLFAMLPEEQGAAYRALWEEFDSVQTPDARFATAMDRLQPFLNNYMTEGHSWRQRHVTEKQVRTRVGMIEDTVPEIWPYVERMLAECIRKGWLIPGDGNPRDLQNP